MQTASKLNVIEIIIIFVGPPLSIFFTPYNPESPSLQTGDENNFKSKDKEKPRPLGRGYTGFTRRSLSNNMAF